jgi:hypothetical protein
MIFRRSDSWYLTPEVSKGKGRENVEYSFSASRTKFNNECFDRIAVSLSLSLSLSLSPLTTTLKSSFLVRAFGE